ncbi:MAG: flagellar hook-length control protein FliK [Pseudomonadota bacterium]
MDIINNIKVTVEPTNNDSKATSKSPAVNSDSDKSKSKIDNKDSFSNKLNDEIDNSKSSQKNITSESDESKEDETGGNILPGDDTNPNNTITESTTETETSLVTQALLIATTEVTATTKSLPDTINTTEQDKNLSSVQQIFKQLNTTSHQFNDDAINTPEIFKNMMLSKKDLADLNSSNKASLFQGSLTQAASLNSNAENINNGFDLSSNSQQQNAQYQSGLNQQMSELEMRLLGQDKLRENSFDISKLTQTLADTQKSLAANESSTFNQLRNVSEFSIKTPVMDKQWNVDFNNNISLMAKSGGGNANIVLNPAHLGPIEASIRVVNDVATIQITATHITTRDALDAAIPRLKDMLEEQGFSQVNVDISDKNFSRNASQESEKSNQGTSSAGNNLADGEEGDFADGELTASSEKSKITGLVDYFA